MWFVARMSKLSPWSLFLRLAFAALVGYFAYVVVNSLLKLKVRFIHGATHTMVTCDPGDVARSPFVWPDMSFSPCLPTYRSSFGVVRRRRRAVGHTLLDTAHGRPEVGQPHTWKWSTWRMAKNFPLPIIKHLTRGVHSLRNLRRVWSQNVVTG